MINKIKFHVIEAKKILTIDIFGELNRENLQKYKKEIQQVVNKELCKFENIEDWRLNIYTCHMILHKENKDCIKDLLDFCVSEHTKMIDIILAKPQKKYKTWFNEVIQKDFAESHIKTLTTNNIFKFK